MPTAVTPPDSLLEDCPSGPSDGSIGAELTRLADLVRCERDDKAAIKTWAEELHRARGM